MEQVVLRPKHADGMANSVDTDQTAPFGAVWSGSALLAQSCLSQFLEFFSTHWIDIVRHKCDTFSV